MSGASNFASVRYILYTRLPSKYGNGSRSMSLSIILLAPLLTASSFLAARPIAGVADSKRSPAPALSAAPESPPPPPAAFVSALPPPAPPGHRAGFVSILGVPNVGKSTLLNALMGEQLSIATSKAQTTRHRILGMVNGEDHQIVFSDTPGVLLPQYKLQEGMMAFVRSSLIDADAVILVVDIFQDQFPDEKLLRQLRASPTALLVLLNKVDLLDAGDASDERRAAKAAERRAKLGTPEALLQRWRDQFPGATVLPIAARSGEGVDEVMRLVLALLPEHPPYYDKEQLSDRPERFFAAEFLREAIFEHYSEEIPYSCECVIEAFKEAETTIRLRADIFVSHESQKGIVIGKGGAALKKVGTRARKRMEAFFDKKIYLETVRRPAQTLVASRAHTPCSSPLASMPRVSSASRSSPTGGRTRARYRILGTYERALRVRSVLCWRLL